jgi:membrane-anchored mycosin MYCP
MTVYEPEYGPSGTSSGNQIVIDSRDLRPIRAELTSLGIEVTSTDQIPELSVVMITLADLGKAASLAEAVGVRKVVARRTGRVVPSNLDVLTTMLRRSFKDLYDREPRMGKNRDMEVVGGLPHWAAATLPEPIEPTRDQFPLLPRTQGMDERVKVGVLDTAMYANQDLVDRYHSDDVVPDQQPRPTWAGHATFLVGRILLRAPDADIEVRQVLGGEYGTATAWELARGMASFLESGVQVLNLSLGCFTVDDEPPFLLARAVERLSAEMLVVAAAGNHGQKSYPMPALDENGKPLWRPEPLSPSSPMWPAALDGVVSVGAANVQRYDGGVTMNPADFTPVNVPWIELWAPGVDVISTYLDGDVTAETWTWEDDGSISRPEKFERKFAGFARWSGTSMSAADVTGEIAKVAQGDIGVREAYRRISARRGGPDEPFDVRPWI